MRTQVEAWLTWSTAFFSSDDSSMDCDRCDHSFIKKSMHAVGGIGNCQVWEKVKLDQTIRYSLVQFVYLQWKQLYSIFNFVYKHPLNSCCMPDTSEFACGAELFGRLSLAKSHFLSHGDPKLSR